MVCLRGANLAQVASSRTIAYVRDLNLAAGLKPMRDCKAEAAELAEQPPPPL